MGRRLFMYCHVHVCSILSSSARVSPAPLLFDPGGGAGLRGFREGLLSQVLNLKSSQLLQCVAGLSCFEPGFQYQTLSALEVQADLRAGQREPPIRLRGPTYVFGFFFVCVSVGLGLCVRVCVCVRACG